MRDARRTAMVALLTGAALALATVPTMATASTVNTVPAGNVGRASDFNGDGYDDLAVGVPFEAVGGDSAAGAVQVFPGGPGGLTTDGDQLFTQDTPGMPDKGEAGDRFGWAIHAANFDNDAYGDLAIGAPLEDRPGAKDSGLVTLLRGSSSGLTTAGVMTFYGSDRLNQATGAEYGYAIASGDNAHLDGSVRAAGPDFAIDLIVSMPGRRADEGGFQILINDDGPFATSKSVNGPGGLGQTGARCGESLAAGALDGVAGDDIAAGCPRYDISGAEDSVNVDAGRVRVFGSDWTTQIRVGDISEAGFVEAGDRFGQSLAIGRVAGEFYDDLVVGVPYEDVGAVADAGVVHVYLGGAAGLDDNGFTFSMNLQPGGPGASDRFGASVLVVDVGGRQENGSTSSSGVEPQGAPISRPDVVIGVPGRDVSGRDRAGALFVAYASWPDPLTEVWTQDSSGVSDAAETGDRFGESLAAGHFRGHGVVQWDLAVGIPFEDVGAIHDAGAVAVLPGGPDTLIAVGDQWFHQNIVGILGTAKKSDRFGMSLGRGSR